MATSKLTKQQRVLNAVNRSGPNGLTSAQVERRTNIDHRSASARLTDLESTRKLYTTGQKRVNVRTGRYGLVYFPYFTPTQTAANLF